MSAETTLLEMADWRVDTYTARFDEAMWPRVPLIASLA